MAKRAKRSTWIDSTDISHVPVCDKCGIVLGIWLNRKEARAELSKHTRSKRHNDALRGSAGRRSCTIAGCEGEVGWTSKTGLCHTHIVAAAAERRRAARAEQLANRPSCPIDGCNEPVELKGLCAPHYRQERGVIRRAVVVKVCAADRCQESAYRRSDLCRQHLAVAVCSVSDCGRSRQARGLCEMHYRQQRREAA